jgi:hypothetical protein
MAELLEREVERIYILQFTDLCARLNSPILYGVRRWVVFVFIPASAEFTAARPSELIAGCCFFLLDLDSRVFVLDDETESDDTV